MRIIHSRIKLNDFKYIKEVEEKVKTTEVEETKVKIFTIKTSDLAFWVNNIVRFKKAGHTLVLYTNTEYIPTIQFYGLDKLYDEVETQTLDNYKRNINIDRFWAAPKLISYEAEIKKGNKDIVVTDTDLFLIKDLKELTKDVDVLLWNKQEFQEVKEYNSIFLLPYPEKFKFPAWFKDGAIECNTGVTWFKDTNIALEWLEASLSYMENNPHFAKGIDIRKFQMVFAEQKTMGMFLTYAHPDLKVRVVQEYYERQFNTKGWHYCMYKWQGEEFFKGYSKFLFDKAAGINKEVVDSFLELEQIKTELLDKEIPDMFKVML
jgi:hypothetical protein